MCGLGTGIELVNDVLVYAGGEPRLLKAGKTVYIKNLDQPGNYKNLTVETGSIVYRGKTADLQPSIDAAKAQA